MGVLKTLNYGIREEIARKKRKRRRHEIMVYVMEAVAALLFLAGLVLSVVNFIENLRRRAKQRSEKRSAHVSVFSKKVSFEDEEAAQETQPRRQTAE